MSTTTLKKPRLGSDTTTNGVRITVQPAYSSLESDPANNYYKFVYRIRIRNESDRTVQLISRHWIIVDANGERQEVRGNGVVGRQPVLEPGQAFEYASFCPLSTPWGTMEGGYQMRELRTLVESEAGVPDAPESKESTAGEGFEARITRFFLVCPPDAATTL
jgi:ApaG protein